MSPSPVAGIPCPNHTACCWLSRPKNDISSQRHLLHQVLEQGQRQAVSRVVGAMVADDAQQAEQIVLTHPDRNRHRDPLSRETPRL
jgi:hypothetical protein